MGLLDVTSGLDIWYFLIPLVLLTVVFFVMLSKMSKREHGLVLTINTLIKKHKATKKDLAEAEKTRSNHIALLINEVGFAVSFLLLIVGYLKQSQNIFYMSLALMVFSLYVFQELMKKEKNPNPHVSKLLDKSDEEEELLSRVNAVFYKEKMLEKKEAELKTQLKELRSLAKRTDVKHKSLKDEELSADIESDTRKVLKVMDDLLDKLPEGEMARFISSSDYKLYKRVMNNIR